MDFFFPIRTQTSCQLKWNWSTLYLYGSRTASCHRTGWGNLTPENFSSFHNTPKKLQERQQMLNGQWPKESCLYCREIEDSGGFSDRMLHNDIPNMSPPELYANPTALAVSPTILEVFFNNTCNMACLYCTPSLSSKINQENRKFGDFTQSGVQLVSENKDNNYEQNLEQFWQWMYLNSTTLKRFNVLGGEPFYQQEFFKLLDYLDSTEHKDLELGIVTNLMVDPALLQANVERLKTMLGKRKLRRVDITCSIDCWGAEQEYVRWGLNLAQWKQNFEFLLTNKWLTINVNQTISVLTIKTMPELLDKLHTWRQQRPIGHYFSAVTPQPSYMMINILGPDVFARDFSVILNMMPTTSKSEQQALQYMQGLVATVNNSQFNNNEAMNLKIFLNEKDRRRGTDWCKTFPWLVKELNRVV